MRLERTYRALPLLLVAVLVACPAEKEPTGPDADSLEITTDALPLAAVGLAYNAGVDAEGGDGEYHWAVESGSLPPGLALSVEDLTDDDVVISGIPEAEGSFAFVLRVESDDEQTRSRAYTLTVLGEPAGIAITTSVLPPALAGAPFDTQLEAAGGDGGGFVWTIESGTLPAGLTLEASGRLHGTPTTSDTAALVFAVESGGEQVSTTLTLQVVANRTTQYDITVAPVVPIPASFVPIVDAAMDRLEAAITGDLTSRQLATNTFGATACGGFGKLVNGTGVDDLIVLVNIAPIDGNGQILGFAGPCLIRSPGGHPIVGILTLDAVDLGFLSATNQIALVTHETSHVIGFGSLWDESPFELIGGTDNDPRFTGTNARAQWQALGGAGDVPVEEDGGAGTAGSHWNEETFGRELMTGFSNTNVFQPMSRMTIASFADLGYTVNLNAADGFSLAPQPPLQGSAAATIAGYDVVLDEIVGALTEDGRMITIREAQR